MGAKKSQKKRLISGIVPDVVREKGWQVKLEMHSFFPIWDKVVSGNAASCSRPLKIVKDVLWLEVENSTWMQQLQFEKMQILDDINATLKLSKIRDIKFLLPRDDQAESEEARNVCFIAPDAKEIKQFEELTGIIEDDAVREALVRLWYLSKSCRREED